VAGQRSNDRARADHVVESPSCDFKERRCTASAPCATGPGGVLVIAPDGRHLGTIRTGQRTANCAFGDDGSTLYMTSDSLLLRIRLATRGTGF
jgi:SMP-30/Gluconolactonase/LRE-like region